MTGITGAETPCSTETVPTACGSADKQRDRSRCRKPFPHWADRLYRIRADPSDGGPFASSAHRTMGAGGVRVSVERTEARTSDTTLMVMASRREPPVGMESCRAVRGSRTRIISLEDRSADRCASTAKRESADTIF